MQNHASLVTMLEQPPMLKRLFVECVEALREFREGPRIFITSAIKDMGPGNRSPTLFRLGLAIALLFYAVVFAGTILLWSLSHHKTGLRLSNTYLYALSFHILPLQRCLMLKTNPEEEAEAGAIPTNRLRLGPCRRLHSQVWLPQGPRRHQGRRRCLLSKR